MHDHMNDQGETAIPADIPEERPHIYAAMLLLMDRVKNIPMTGTMAVEAGGYRFRGIDDMIRDVGAAARDVAVMLQSQVIKAEYTENKTDRWTWTSCRLVLRYIFTSLEDGSEVSFEAAGEGRDNADKATAKAMSMALKYCLGQALLIGTDDPDPDSERPGAQAPPAQQDRPAPQPPADAPAAAPAGDKPTRARQALSAAQNAKDRNTLAGVSAQAVQEGLLDEVIGGIPLRERIETMRELLP